ncbi:DUF4255 domain-containing protein [Chitinophaga oryziterrae]|uniref:DUF4255 domain-containing protein n=1 Tax=Chitinophaga oryziterrae TaxID=1031224 RepID=A0A6N8JH24_9BACT|nr:DUF4255 domain-containing protein [Chitinophaga oryziterrae]MVT44527.1 DUF4255 domain-containing protein [Chitinophaga oryziterrae]
MIYETLACITEEINKHFSRQLHINEEKVVLSGIINQDGTVAIQGENKVLVTLINIEKEALGKVGAGRFSGNTMPPVCINLYILFSAYFSSNNYPEALRFISFIIAYFQSGSVLTQANTPSLDSRIDKLTFEMESMGTEKMNNIWATLGAKYMPSVVYKMRMLTFDESIIKEYRPIVRASSADNTPL